MKQQNKKKQLKQSKQAKQSKQSEQPNPAEQTKQEELPPEVQEKLDLFIINGMNIIHSEEMSKTILTKVQNYPDPLKAIAELTVSLVQRLKESAASNGQELGDNVIAHGGNILMGEIMKVLEAAGMEPLTEKQRLACWQLAISQYMDSAVKNGEMSKEDLISQANRIKKTPKGKKILKTAQKPEFKMAQGGQVNG